MSAKLKEFRQLVRELVEQELDEMTTTGDVGGFGTPFAFQGDRPANKRKRKASAQQAGYTLAAESGEGEDNTIFEVLSEGSTAPEWEYKDARGVKHRGHVQHVSDRGGTDVTYFFIDKDSGELSVLGGPAVKRGAHAVGKASKPHPKYFQRKESVNEGGDPYYPWRNDETTTPRQKIGSAISEINKQLAEVEKVVRRSSRLKKEMGVPNSGLWKRTNNSLMKMESRMHRIAQTLRNMRG